jgi:hypothetical protein
VRPTSEGEPDND